MHNLGMSTASCLLGVLLTVPGSMPCRNQRLESRGNQQQADDGSAAQQAKVLLIATQALLDLHSRQPERYPGATHVISLRRCAYTRMPVGACASQLAVPPHAQLTVCLCVMGAVGRSWRWLSSCKPVWSSTCLCWLWASMPTCTCCIS